MKDNTVVGSTLNRLFGAGAHFAQIKSRRHPSMKPYLVGAKSRVEIFDLSQTEEQIKAAKAAMKTLAEAGKTVLFVGGKREISDAVRAAALAVGAPFVASRWLGGTVSNFAEIKKRIDRLADLTQKRDSGELARQHTKLELIYIDREIKRLLERFEGITTLSKRPDAFVIVDTKREAHATREARRFGIPVIGIMSSDCDLADATYPIVMNDASREAVTYVLGELSHAYEEGRKT